MNLGLTVTIITNLFLSFENEYLGIIHRRLSRCMQIGGLVPVVCLGVPPRYKASKLCNSLRSLRCVRKEHLFE